jgi:hypothetical protein
MAKKIDPNLDIDIILTTPPAEWSDGQIMKLSACLSQDVHAHCHVGNHIDPEANITCLPDELIESILTVGFANLRDVIIESRRTN